jgi:hypothetical protein
MGFSWLGQSFSQRIIFVALRGGEFFSTGDATFRATNPMKRTRE